MTLSQKEAQLLVLHQQGLIGKALDNPVKILDQLSYIQIDTISVTERAHHHVVYTRFKNYQKEDLNDFVKQTMVFEYWSHAAAYLPIKDFSYSLYPKSLYKNGEKHWFPRDKKIEKYVIERIQNEGPLSSKDFENQRNKKHKWYDWKPAKIALTNLFMDGTIMIKERKGFQKVFDLSENIIPEYPEIEIPTVKEFAEHLILNAINAQGLISVNEISYLRKGMKAEVKKVLLELEENKQLLQVNTDSEIYYSSPTLVNSINSISTNNEIHFLSPFDNLIIQRKRLKTLFNFDYQIECYVPEAKRKYGYYAIPVLYNGKFTGRFDAKADRKTNTFYLKSFWEEKDAVPTEDYIQKLSKEFLSFAQFCGCNTIKYDKQKCPKVIKGALAFL